MLVSLRDVEYDKKNLALVIQSDTTEGFVMDKGKIFFENVAILIDQARKYVGRTASCNGNTGV